ncbi:MAG: MBL fold metallo-hydrolase [Euzebyales bacterium]|nr:MBL fold metallo-hydrolase [Euzebyales bacterium]
MRRLDEVTEVVLAPNPSPLTLEGTNTYLLGEPGTGEVVVVDPGPDLLAHRENLEAAVAGRDARVVAVVVTHAHADHAEAAGWACDWGVEVAAFTPALVGVEAAPLHDADRIARAGVTLEVLHTPGHSSDHVCLRVSETGAVLTGDHVLGRGTSVVAWPDGDMAAYLGSLRRLAGCGATALYPGHGPVRQDPAGTVAGYLAHRQQREEQIIDALTAGDATPGEVVTRVYAGTDPALHPAAERSVRAHLAKLVDDGRVVAVGTTGGRERFRVR